MNEMNVVPVEEVRDIGVVTSEINVLVNQYKSLTVAYAVEIGRRLHEAKALLEHGEWGTWLKEKVNFSQRTANNLMRVCDEYADAQITLFGAVPKSQALANLSLTKAIRLLALDEDEREEFVGEHDVEGMSTRELEQAIRERQAAEKLVEQLEAERDELTEQVSKLGDDLSDADIRETNLKGEKLELERKLQAAEKKAEDAEAERKKAVSDAKEAQKKVKDGQKAAVEKAVADAEKRLKNAEDALKLAENEKLEIERKLLEMQKNTQLQDPDVAAFKTMFEQVQDDIGKLYTILTRIEERTPETAEKLKAALHALAGQIGGDGK